VVELHVELSCDCPRGIASDVLNLYAGPSTSCMYVYLGIDNGREYAAVLHTSAVPPPLSLAPSVHGDGEDAGLHAGSPGAAVVVMVGVVSRAPGYAMTALSRRRRRLALAPPTVEVKSAPGYTPVAHALPSSRSAKYRGRRAARWQPRATDAIVLGVVRV
jgi:hypothetical protein